MNNDDLSRNLLTFAAGAAAGGLAALLFAPMKGSDLRSRIGEEAEARKDEVQTRVRDLSERTSERASELTSRAQESASELLERTSQKLGRTREQTEESILRGAENARHNGAAFATAVRAGLQAFEQTLDEKA